MTFNSGLGTYVYPAAGSAGRRTAPQLVAGTRNFNYDANGNTKSDGTRNYDLGRGEPARSVGRVTFAYAPDGGG